MSQIEQEIQKLSPSALLSLFTLDTTKLGGTLLRFTKNVNGLGTAGVIFGGVTYIPLDIEFEGFEISGVGSIPRPTMKLANTDGLIQALVNTWGDLNGCSLQRVRTFARFLDGAPGADASAYFGPDIFDVDRKVSDTPSAITWELSASIDQEGRHIGRPMIRDTCLWKYRRWNPTSGTFNYTQAKCPYTGGTFYDVNDAVVAGAANDVPSRKLSCCKARFGAAAPLPYGGFPGLSRTL